MARIAGINIPPNKIVSIDLTYIHGIGLHSSKQICEKLNISKDVRVNNLTEDQVLKITEYINTNHKVEGDLRRDISLNINSNETFFSNFYRINFFFSFCYYIV